MKKFKARRNKSNLIWYIGLFLISIAFSVSYLLRNNLVNNDTIMNVLLNDVSKKEKITDIDFLLKYALNINLNEEQFVFNIDDKNINNKVLVTENINNYNNSPLIYIYNTHQTEKYKSDYLENYNISSTVLVASKILKEYLTELGFNVIVEENDVAATLNSLNWKYGYSYKVSRMFLENTYKENPSLVYFIDLHRDSSVYEKTTAEIDGEKYAKILFVVGLDHNDYEKNLQFAEDLSAILKKYNEKLYRGITKKSGKGVNGIYNQDFSENTMLIEVGGQYNNISEVNNTLKIFAQVLRDYIKENYNEKEKN